MLKFHLCYEELTNYLITTYDVGAALLKIPSAARPLAEDSQEELGRSQKTTSEESNGYFATDFVDRY